MLTASVAAALHLGAPASSSEVSGPATATSRILTGTSRTTVQVSSADAMWLTCASGPGPSVVPSRPTGWPRVRPSVPTSGRRAATPARTGTTTLVSAPPSTMS